MKTSTSSSVLSSTCTITLSCARSYLNLDGAHLCLSSHSRMPATQTKSRPREAASLLSSSSCSDLRITVVTGQCPSDKATLKRPNRDAICCIAIVSKMAQHAAAPGDLAVGPLRQVPADRILRGRAITVVVHRTCGRSRHRGPGRRRQGMDHRVPLVRLSYRLMTTQTAKTHLVPHLCRATSRAGECVHDLRSYVVQP